MKAPRLAINPVLARELTQRMRGRLTWLVITVYLGLLALILRFLYLGAARFSGGFGEPLAATSVGRSVFAWLLFFMLVLVCFIVPGLTAAAISGERERQTLVSLQLTLLSARSIVTGKLAASVAFVSLLVVASLPLLSVPFLVGGVSVSEVIRGVAMVAVSGLWLACISLACSAALRRTQGATVVAYGVTVALVLGTFVFYGAQFAVRRSGPSPAPTVLMLNPFVATADVVQGRNDSIPPSPFSVLRGLLRATPEPAARPDGVVETPSVSPLVDGTVNTTAVRQDPVVSPVERRTKVAGLPFWAASLAVWAVLGVASLAVAVRRVTVPRS